MEWPLSPLILTVSDICTTSWPRNLARNCKKAQIVSKLGLKSILREINPKLAENTPKSMQELTYNNFRWNRSQIHLRLEGFPSKEFAGFCKTKSVHSGIKTNRIQLKSSTFPP